MSDHRIIKDINNKIESELNRIGLLSRVFSRLKSKNSLQQKFDKSPGKYSSTGKKVQDYFGVRIALYFSDDSKITQEILKTSYGYEENSSTIDLPKENSFEAIRHNLIFRLPDDPSKINVGLTKALNVWILLLK